MEFARSIIFSGLALWFALPARAQEAETTRAKRIAVESAVSLSATALAIGGGFGAGVGSTRRCIGNDDDLVDGLGCSFRGTAITMAVMFTALPAALTLGSYVPHRALDGRGRWYAALAGAAVGIGGGLGIVSIPAASKDGGAPLFVGATAAALLAATMPILALEWSHGRQERRERERAPRFAPVASALPSGGAWLGVAGAL